MNREQIMQVLPHRAPMLLVDSIEPQPDGSVLARYTVPEKPFFCEGHFPGNPIVPGVILCEMMAQSCCMLFADAFKENLLVYRSMDQVKFRAEVHPCDTCEIHARLVEHKGSVYMCDVNLSVEGKRCAQGRITLAAGPR